MLVSEILRIKGTALYTTPPEAPVIDAVKVMAQHDIGSLVVMDHGRMAGIVTFAEVLRALAERDGTLGDAQDQRDHRPDPLTAAPSIDVMELRRIMLERHARYVPVMDGTRCGGRVLPRRRQGGPRRAELREPDTQELHQRRARLSGARGLARTPLTPAARRSPGVSRSARNRGPPVADRPRSIVSVASVRSAATQSRVRGRHVATSAQQRALRYGVSMKSCA